MRMRRWWKRRQWLQWLLLLLLRLLPLPLQQAA